MYLKVIIGGKYEKVITIFDDELPNDYDGSL